MGTLSGGERRRLAATAGPGRSPQRAAASMSQPTTWISTRCERWRTSWSNGRALWSLSVMTGRSSTESSTGSSLALTSGSARCPGVWGVDRQPLAGDGRRRTPPCQLGAGRRGGKGGGGQPGVKYPPAFGDHPRLRATQLDKELDRLTRERDLLAEDSRGRRPRRTSSDRYPAGRRPSPARPHRGAVARPGRGSGSGPLITQPRYGQRRRTIRKRR